MDIPGALAEVMCASGAWTGDQKQFRTHVAGSVAAFLAGVLHPITYRVPNTHIADYIESETFHLVDNDVSFKYNGVSNPTGPGFCHL